MGASSDPADPHGGNLYSKAVAFVLGLISFLPPFSGLLRFYLKHWGSGTLYTMTAGFCFIGNILDIVQIPRLVDEANRKWKRREMARLIEADRLVLDAPGTPDERPAVQKASPASVRRNLEKIILESARSNKGYTTPSQVAIESELTLEEARIELDKLVTRGFAAMRVNKAGVIVYHFSDFIENTALDSFEDL